MYQAILCDDNEIILEGLTKQIKWGELGISLIGTATNGEDALSMIYNKVPDILITDIRMPYLDGLKLAEKSKELNPNLSIIIISGYNDFEYAHSAIRLGAVDYILKPIDPNELIRVLKNAVRYCEDINHGLYISIVELLRNVLYQDLSLNILSNRCAQVNLSLDWYCSVIKVEMNSAELKLLSAELQYNADLRFSQLLEQLYRPNKIYIIEKESNKCMLFLYTSTKKEHEELQTEIISLIRKRYFPEHKSNDIVIASGNIHRGIANGTQSMKECNYALTLRFIKGSNATIFYEEVRTYSQAYEKNHYHKDLLEIDLLTPIKTQDSNLLEERLNLLKSHLSSKGDDSFLYMTLTVGNLYTSLLKELDELGIDISDVFANPIDEFKRITAPGTLDAIIENLHKSLIKISICVSKSSSKYGRIIETANRYIQVNYNNPNLSIEEVAIAVSLSTSYFSTIFKNETGSTFTDYLIEIRMKKAMELLKTTNMKMYEISSHIGYENAAYFSTAFKRYTKKSPSEYQITK